MVSRRLVKAARAGRIPPRSKAKPAPQQETKPEPEGKPKAWALVTWSPRGELTMAAPRYFTTRSEAEAAAPNAVHSIVNITTKPSRRRRSEVDDILRQGRGVMRNPYPQYRTRDTL
jgi:hypothetical protein